MLFCNRAAVDMHHTHQSVHLARTVLFCITDMQVPQTVSLFSDFWNVEIMLFDPYF